MARPNDPDTRPIYDLAHHWLTEVLPTSDSLLSPGTKIWTQENLAELIEKFIGRPDTTPGKSFLAKLKDQLHDASPAAVQLMAEVHVITFLWVWKGAISAQKKLSDIDAVLSWHPDRPQVPANVAQAMAPGLVHPGQWAMTRRDTQLGGVIQIAAALTAAPSDEFHRLVGDPWAFRDFVSSVPAPSAENAKLALVHVAFPDTFEAIVAAKHKEWIADRFTELAGPETDVDRRLLAIRDALTSTYGPGYSYYDADTDPLVHLWWKNAKLWSATMHWSENLWESVDHDQQEREYKLVIASALSAARSALMEDDPDWRQLLREALAHRINNLMAWQDRDTLLKWVESSPDAAASALKDLWLSEDTESDRVDRFRERLLDPGITTTGSVLNLASMLLMAQEPTLHPPLKVSVLRLLWKLSNWQDAPADSSVGHIYARAISFFDEVLRATVSWDRPPRDRLDIQGLLWSLARIKDKPAGWSASDWERFLEFRGGAMLDDSSDPSDEAPIDPLVEPSDDPSETSVDQIELAAKDLCVERGVLDEIVSLLEDKRQVVLYGPPGTGKTYLARRLSHALVDGDTDRIRVVQFHPATTYEDFFEGLRPELVNGQVHYSLQEGPLAALAREAREHGNRRYVMVVDELNRANIPKVFGELLYLLEYRNDQVATLYRSKELFTLPDNLYFIATMNTADRSVALVDAALRRRFHFVPFFPDSGPMKGLLRRWLMEKGQSTATADLLDSVNAELVSTVGHHLLIGPSHFMKEDQSEASLQRIWDFSIFPTLEELLWGREEDLDRWKWPAVRRRYRDKLKLAALPEDEGDDSAAGIPTATDISGAENSSHDAH